MGTAPNAIVVLDGAGIPGTEHLCREPGLLDRLRAEGPAELLRRLRATGSGTPDDATIAFCEPHR